MRRLALLLPLAAALIAGCGGGSSTEETTNASLAVASGEEPARSAERDEGERAPRAIAEKAPGSPRASAAEAPPTGTKIKLVDSEFGRVLADRRGEALYLFDRDGRGSRCYGTCAEVWPPVLTEGTPRALGAVAESRLGTTKRADGRRQVTYAGRPLYYYVGDSPGSILCNDVFEFGGLWLVVDRDGRGVS